MITLRPTKTLARQLRISLPAVPPPVPSRVADWCAHIFEWHDGPMLIFCNTASLYPVLASANNVSDGESLARRVGGMVPRVLKENGFLAQMKCFEAELTDFQFAPVPDRSVLGSINELLLLAQAHLGDSRLNPWTLSQRLGKTPMSALGMKNPARALASLGR